MLAPFHDSPAQSFVSGQRGPYQFNGIDHEESGLVGQHFISSGLFHHGADGPFSFEMAVATAEYPVAVQWARDSLWTGQENPYDVCMAVSPQLKLQTFTYQNVNRHIFTDTCMKVNI